MKPPKTKKCAIAIILMLVQCLPEISQKLHHRCRTTKKILKETESDSIDTLTEEQQTCFETFKQQPASPSVL